MGHVPIAWKKSKKSKEVHDDSRNQCPREGEGGRAFQRGREVPAAGKKVLDESLNPMIYNEEVRLSYSISSRRKLTLSMANSGKRT